MTVSRRSFLASIAGAIGLGIVTKPKKPCGHNLVAIDLLEQDYTRPLSNNYIDELKRSISKIGLMMPVTVAMNKGRFILMDGNHRVEAYRCLNKRVIECRFIEMMDHQIALWRKMVNV